MKIIFSGGGTLGPVIPLLEVARLYKQHNPAVKYIWIGTKHGPEEVIIKEAGLPFLVIGAGKWRRYVSLWNIFDLFKIAIAFFQAIFLLIVERPQLLISAGGYVSVPLHWAAALLAIPTWVHQQDIHIGLANSLMFPFAKKITTTLKETAARLPPKKTEWLGNPSREFPPQQINEARVMFNIPSTAPAVIFALGGGTGSMIINKMIIEMLPILPRDWHVIHLTGKERPGELSERAAGAFENYHVYKFFTSEMAAAYAAANIIVARAGFATLTELAYLSKPAIIVPMSKTHQEDNARFFAAHNAIVTLKEQTEGGLQLAHLVKHLMEYPAERTALGARLHEVLPRAKPERVVQIIETITK